MLGSRVLCISEDDAGSYVSNEDGCRESPSIFFLLLVTGKSIEKALGATARQPSDLVRRRGGREEIGASPILEGRVHDNSLEAFFSWWLASVATRRSGGDVGLQYLAQDTAVASRASRRIGGERERARCILAKGVYAKSRCCSLLAPGPWPDVHPMCSLLSSPCHRSWPSTSSPRSRRP